MTKVINKITLNEHCFGSSFILNEDIRFDSDGDSDGDNDHNHNHNHNHNSKDMIIKELSNIKDELSESEWKDILELISSKRCYKYVKEESSSDSCEQCGNWNSTMVYEKLK